MKRDHLLLPGDFHLDGDLVVLREKSDRTINCPAPMFFFYVNSGRVYGSDGSIHVPLNPAILTYFTACFEPYLKKSRGFLSFFLNGQENERYCIVTDNINLTASLQNYKTALALASKENLKNFSHELG